MPKIAFVGDIHGQLVKMYAALMDWMERTGIKIDAVVQLGDLGVFGDTEWGMMWRDKTPAPIPTWALMGNHEDIKWINRWSNDPYRIPGMHLLPDGEITEVLGLKIGSIWGNYSPVSWQHPERVILHRALAWEDQPRSYSERIAMHINRLAVERLLALPGPMDVLVTHDSSPRTLPAEFKVDMASEIKEAMGLEKWERAGGCPGFDQIIDQFQPRRYFFGHLHRSATIDLGPTKACLVDALGYSPHWSVIIDVNEAKKEEAQGGTEHGQHVPTEISPS